MKKYKIGWQKYEDFLEKQMSSPLLDLFTHIVNEKMPKDQNEEGYESTPYEEQDESEENEGNFSSVIPISPQLMEEISMLSAYDCWIGHTNFDITLGIKNKLDRTEGVEVLQILSRYRFFIGLGKLFDFKQVRSDIEKTILPENSKK